MKEDERLRRLEQLRDAAERAYAIAVRAYADAALDEQDRAARAALERVYADASRAYAVAALEARLAQTRGGERGRADARAAVEARNRAAAELDIAYANLDRAYADAGLDARDRITRATLERAALDEVRTALDAIALDSTLDVARYDASRIARARAGCDASARVARTRIALDEARDRAIGPDRCS